ncbi:hypothetical protein DFJ77DRAFT_460138 [Powellomyces hirtus]|nr:hypothetical protein DFJ77DRAFT_460138 [Powellomyces hirtus]
MDSTPGQVKPMRYAASVIVCAPIKQQNESMPPCESDFKVLMLKRNARGAFGSLHVYPGGMVDPEDSSANWRKLLSKEDESRVARSNMKDILPYYIAAVRETFEESGIALTTPPPSLPIAELTQWRKKVHSTASAFIDFCAAARTRPNVSQLVHWCNWITPTTVKSRFDTQFFLTILDTAQSSTGGAELGQVGKFDGIETVDLDWFTPQQALDAFDAGRIALFLPQYCTLLELSTMKLSDLQSYVAGDRSRTPADLAPMLPERRTLDNGQTVLVLAGDELHAGTPGAKGQLHRVHVRMEKDQFKEIRVVKSDGKDNAKL